MPTRRTINVSRDALSYKAIWQLTTDKIGLPEQAAIFVNFEDQYMETHFSERLITDGTNSRAKWARVPDGRMFVFIHGYGGNAVSTWSEFDLRLPGEKTGSNADLIFYGYDGIRSNVVASASLFRTFLERLLSSPTEVINSTLPTSARRSTEFQFKEIIVVAHSLGAVIARWALLFAYQGGETWVQSTKLFLFAPAHTGASIVRLALSAVSGFPIVVPLGAAAFRFYSPLVDELEPGSDVLLELDRETNKMLSEGYTSLRAVRVFIAEREHIVKNLPFKGDPPPVAFAGTNHFSVCKPRRAFTRPIDEIVKAI